MGVARSGLRAFNGVCPIDPSPPPHATATLHCFTATYATTLLSDPDRNPIPRDPLHTRLLTVRPAVKAGFDLRIS